MNTLHAFQSISRSIIKKLHFSRSLTTQSGANLAKNAPLPCFLLPFPKDLLCKNQQKAFLRGAHFTLKLLAFAFAALRFVRLSFVASPPTFPKTPDGSPVHYFTAAIQDSTIHNHLSITIIESHSPRNRGHRPLSLLLISLMDTCLPICRKIMELIIRITTRP